MVDDVFNGLDFDDDLLDLCDVEEGNEVVEDSASAEVERGSGDGLCRIRGDISLICFYRSMEGTDSPCRG